MNKIPQTELMLESLEKLKVYFQPILLPFSIGILGRMENGAKQVDASAQALELMKSHPRECANFLVCAVQVIAALNGDPLAVERTILNEDLTPEEYHNLEHAPSLEEWTKVCDAVKAVRGGVYPSCWFERMIASGLIARKQKEWRKAGS